MDERTTRALRIVWGLLAGVSLLYGAARAEERTEFKTADKPAVSASQALAILTSWIRGQSSYPLPDKCRETKPQGMKAGGFLFEIRKKYCAGISMPGPLDLWRVDASTGQVTIREADGKFKPPKPKPNASRDDQDAQSGPSFYEVEQLLIFNGYGYSLEAAEDLSIRYGAKLLPVLEILLTNVLYYEGNAMRTGAFPLNAIWLLGSIGNDQAKAMLERYRKSSGNVLADLALAGLELRRKTKDRDCAVLSSRATLLTYASQLAPPMVELEAGQALRLLMIRISNEEESSPHGGPALFDSIELIPSGEQGYIERTGTGDALYF